VELYEPELASLELDSIPKLLEYILRENRRISLALAGALPSELPELHVAPTKVRTGMIRLADGTDWNPGAGQGVYAYYNGTWNKLG
jgi:hypothetical protein